MLLTRTLLTILILSFNSALADEKWGVIRGDMTCRVTEQKVLDVMDGRATMYSGFQEKFNVGDKLAFEYEYHLGGMSGLYVTLRDSLRSDIVMNSFVGGEFADVDVNQRRLIIEAVRGGRILLGDNFIMVNDDLTRQITLRRYYKSDWAGLYVESPNAITMTAHVVALDCRTGTDAIEKIIETATVE